MAGTSTQSNPMAGARALQGKVALVTGASRGLGRRVAVTLAAAGATVALVARAEADLREGEREIMTSGGAARVFHADITSAESVERLKADVTDAIGPVSVLVNAAGIFGPIALIKDSDPRQWLQTLAVNVAGPYLTCRAFAGAMVEHGWGRIVNFSSAAALHPPGPLNSAYATSKVALNQLTRHLAAELAGTGVTANVIHPGDVKTDMWADIRDQASRMGAEGEPYRKWVAWVEKTGGDHPQKAADLVLRLATEDGAAAPTGQFHWIEGGLQAPIPSWDAPKDERPWKD